MLVPMTIHLPDQEAPGSVEQVINLPNGLRLAAASAYVETADCVDSGEDAALTLEVLQGASGEETAIVSFTADPTDDGQELAGELTDVRGVNLAGSAALQRVVCRCTVAGDTAAEVTGVRFDLWLTRPLIPPI